MNALKLFLAAIFLLGAQFVAAQTAAPLKLATKYDMPAAVKGRFDHLGIDLGGNRLFVVGEEAQQVLVFDLSPGNLSARLKSITRTRSCTVKTSSAFILRMKEKEC